MERFKGKVVVVTGAGSGIGEATARRFVEEGASVMICDKEADKLSALEDELPPGQVAVEVADISIPGDCTRLVDSTVEKFGRLDVLINNAGVDQPGSVAELADADWRRVIDNDLSGVFYMTRAAMPHLVKVKGAIINTASVSGLGGDWGHAAYCAAKGGIVNFTRATAMDSAKDGVRINAVCPTFTLTDMTKDMANNQSLMSKFRERIPMQRIAMPEDIAGVIAFLASEDAGFITGVALPVDGGISASNGQPSLA